MSVFLWLAMALAGSLGALARWNLDLLVRRVVDAVAQRRSALSAPTPPALSLLGIGVVNILGCLLLGCGAGFFAEHSALGFIASTGFLGGFTTFSTAVMDVWNLWNAGRRLPAVALLISVWSASLLAVVVGLQLG